MPKKSVSKNVARLNEDMRRELIEILNSMKDPRVNGGLITITKVENVSDLSTCKVHISVMDRPGGAAEVIKGMNAAKGYVRSEIAQRMHIRRSPEFVFIEDDSAAYADHINRLLKNL